MFHELILRIVRKDLFLVLLLRVEKNRKIAINDGKTSFVKVEFALFFVMFDVENF